MKKFDKEEKYGELAELFKIFGDGTRLKILTALYGEERNVGELAAELGMTESAVSHQLRVLKNSRLVKGRREGKNIYYSPADDHVETIILMGMEHIEEPR